MSNALRMDAAAAQSEQGQDFAGQDFFWTQNYAEGVPTQLDVPSVPLFSLLDDSAAKFPARPALRTPSAVYDYASLASLANRAAAGLQALGIGKGVKVGLFMPNSAAGVVMYFAILKSGATVVNYNPVYVERDLMAQVEDSETDFMVTLDMPALRDKAAGIMQKTRLKRLIVCPAAEDLRAPTIADDMDGVTCFANLLQVGDKPKSVSIDADEDIAVLQYTGGTTGVPKGAMLTHKNLYANALQMSHWYHAAVEGEDSMVVVLPLFHVFAMTVAMNMPLMKGMQMLLQPQFGVSEVLGLIRDYRPAYMAGVPTMYIALANDGRAAEHDFNCLKFCLSGGAPLPADVKRVFEERTRVRLLAEGYGLTEFSPVATCNPHTKKARAGSIGLPIPGTVVEIVSLEDGKTVLAAKEKGEVVVTGPQMMKGYYKRDTETAAVIKNGRLHTGDVGYMDADGFVYLVDRVKDLVLVGGFNVYPRHVEEVIYTHPAVEECIVAGVPDKLRGEAVQAWVKLRAGESVSVDTLKTFLKDKLSPTEMPKKIVIRDLPLPKTAVGKLSKKDLLEEEGIVRR